MEKGNKKISILIITGLFPPDIGGPATYSKLLFDELTRRGVRVGVLSFGSVRAFPVGIRHILFCFMLIAKGIRYTHFFAQDPVSVGLPSLFAAKLLRKKFAVRIPGDYAWEQGKRRFGIRDSLDEFQKKNYGLRVEFLRKIQRRVVKRAHTVIVPSNYMNKIVSTWGVRPVTIYSSIKFPLGFTKPTVRPEGFLIVSAGRRVPWKGFEALEEIVKKEKGWNLFIAENLSRKETLGWIKIADVFVLNSTYEGLSHLLIEAMSLGTPIIATNVGGNPELIENNVSGLLTSPLNNEELYTAIKNIEEDTTNAQLRAKEGQKRSEDFSVEKTVPELYRILQSL